MSDKKEELSNFLDAMVDDNPEQAQVHFHSYLEDKMRDLIHPELDELEDENVSDVDDSKKTDEE